jgi:hypothetical protein
MSEKLDPEAKRLRNVGSAPWMRSGVVGTTTIRPISSCSIHSSMPRSCGFVFATA